MITTVEGIRYYELFGRFNFDQPEFELHYQKNEWPHARIVRLAAEWEGDAKLEAAGILGVAGQKQFAELLGVTWE